MDEKTVKALLAEAKKNYKRSRRRFERFDNSEDMNEMDQWDAAATWLGTKLAAPTV